MVVKNKYHSFCTDPSVLLLFIQRGVVNKTTVCRPRLTAGIFSFLYIPGSYRLGMFARQAGSGAIDDRTQTSPFPLCLYWNYISSRATLLVALGNGRPCDWSSIAEETCWPPPWRHLFYSNNMINNHITLYSYSWWLLFRCYSRLFLFSVRLISSY